MDKRIGLSICDVLKSCAISRGCKMAGAGLITRRSSVQIRSPLPKSIKPFEHLAREVFCYLGHFQLLRPKSVQTGRYSCGLAPSYSGFFVVWWSILIFFYMAFIWFLWVFMCSQPQNERMGINPKVSRACKTVCASKKRQKKHYWRSIMGSALRSL